MRLHLSFLCLLTLVAGLAQAYPPAPAHRIYGMVRTEQGAPLIALQGVVILYRGTQEVARGFTDPSLGAGINYELNVSMDAGLFGSLYQPDAVIAGTAFTIKVFISGVAYIPIEMSAENSHTLGQPGESTRLNLSLGIDSDGDGLSDAWEQSLIASDTTGKLRTLADITSGGDIDGDGLTNLQEQILGASPNNASDGLKLEVVEVVAGQAHVRFVSTKGRTFGIKASDDFRTWVNVPFALESGGTTGLSYLATDTTIVHAYIALNGKTTINLKLTAQ